MRNKSKPRYGISNAVEMTKCGICGGPLTKLVRAGTFVPGTSTGNYTSICEKESCAMYINLKKVTGWLRDEPKARSSTSYLQSS